MKSPEKAAFLLALKSSPPATDFGIKPSEGREKAFANAVSKSLATLMQEARLSNGPASEKVTLDSQILL